MNNIEQNKDISGNSKNWANWMATLESETCNDCEDNHGRIFPISILNQLKSRPVKRHPDGRCVYVPMRTKLVGTATNQGKNGADFYLYHYNKLPDYYINKENAALAGWINTYGNLHTILPNKMIGGEIYKNKNQKLPMNAERNWYEADINYSSGFRNGERILYSNDGLLFITLDHYHTFYEII